MAREPSDPTGRAVIGDVAQILADSVRRLTGRAEHQALLMSAPPLSTLPPGSLPGDFLERDEHVEPARQLRKPWPTSRVEHRLEDAASRSCLDATTPMLNGPNRALHAMP